jgi:predicted dehydrogenase
MDRLNMRNRPLQIGILGAANIARNFIAGVAPSKMLTVAAVASRDPAKAEAFARETGVPRFHGSYEALLADREIDAVYIPLPNSLHAEWAIRAAESGKPILCEKPLAVTGKEGRRMFAAARANNVPLVEAYPYLAQVQTAKLRKMIATGAIGKVKLIRSSFGITSVDPANIRLSPSLGGGALLDAGSYAMSLIRIVAGERPARVQATASFAANGVDLTTIANIAFPSGLLAQLSCSFETGYHRHALIGGDGGVIETNFLNHPPASGPAILQVKRGIAFGAAFEPLDVPDGNGFLREAESIAASLSNGPVQWTGATEAESLDILDSLDAIRASAQTGAWVELSE